MKTPYIKPTRRMHDSGYRIMEVGYHDGDENITVLGECSDHVFSEWDQKFSVNIDLTKKGYIRLWSREGELRWKDENWVGSSAGLICVPKG